MRIIIEVQGNVRYWPVQALSSPSDKLALSCGEVHVEALKLRASSHILIQPSLELVKPSILACYLKAYSKLHEE